MLTNFKLWDIEKYLQCRCSIWGENIRLKYFIAFVSVARNPLLQYVEIISVQCTSSAK